MSGQLFDENSEIYQFLSMYTPSSLRSSLLSKYGVLAVAFIWCNGKLKDKVSKFVEIVFNLFIKSEIRPSDT